ncbi:MAG: GMC family oxidoreductase, partial [Ramlibacter sp.]|nr:GMC family oxidoreductase [Ramlibacter sp.]
LGGAALHHFGTWLRLRASDFRMRSLYGVGDDWPIAYEDLRLHYDAVQSEMGIAGDAGRERGRPPGEPYPMPAHPLFQQARLLARGFARIGLEPSPLPVAINSRVFKGRAACQYDGWCEAGCPIGALVNPLVLDMQGALAAGASVHAQCTVTRVLCDSSGRARAVEYLHGDERHEIAADHVVLAASVVQNPRILLNSKSSVHPAGVGNASGRVGTGVMVDLIAPVHGIFPGRTQPERGVNAGQLLVRREYGEGTRPRPPGAYQWQIAPSHKPNDLLGFANMRPDLYGVALDRFMRSAARSIGSAVGFAGAVPDPANRIELDSRTGSDGMPLARLTYSPAPSTMALRAHLVSEGMSAFRAAGAKQVWADGPAGGHAIGGTPMGANPATSVCDEFGRCHDAPNVMLAGAGIYPAGSGTSPTFTLYALANRAAQHVFRA